MLDFYVWNPRTKKEQPSEGSLKNIIKSIIHGGSVGHMGLAVTVYGNPDSLEAIRKQFPDLKFHQAFPSYEKTNIGKKIEVVQYQRERKLKGLTAFLGLWPNEKVSKTATIKSFLGTGGKIARAFNEKLMSDMNDCSNIERVILHHLDENFQPSALTKKLNDLTKKKDKLAIERDEIVNELKQLIDPAPKTELEKGLEAIRKIKQEVTKGNTSDLLHKLANEKNQPSPKILQKQNQDLNLELKKLKKTFHSLLLDANIPKIYVYLDGYRQLTSEFNKINTFYEDARDAKLFRKNLTDYLKRYSDNEDAKKLLSISDMIEEKSKIINENKKILAAREDKLNDLSIRLSSTKKQLEEIQKDIEELGSEIPNIESTQGLNPDHDVELPTNESGLPYYIDQIAILEKMEAIKNDPKYQYDVFDKNCARFVKECLLNGISKPLRKDILQLPDVSEHFFDTRFLETPITVIKWILQLNGHINTLNQNSLEQKSKNMRP